VSNDKYASVCLGTVCVNAGAEHMESGLKYAADSIAGGIMNGSVAMGNGFNSVGWGLGVGLLAMGIGYAFGQAWRQPSVIRECSLIQLIKKTKSLLTVSDLGSTPSGINHPNLK
jgi:hypothetical protein